MEGTLLRPSDTQEEQKPRHPPSPSSSPLRAEQIPRFPSLTPEPSSVAGSSASQPVDASPTRPSTPAGVRNIDDILGRDLDGILHFLKCCKPPMDRLPPAFIPLSAVPDWDPDSILSFFLLASVKAVKGNILTLIVHCASSLYGLVLVPSLHAHQ